MLGIMQKYRFPVPNVLHSPYRCNRPVCIRVRLPIPMSVTQLKWTVFAFTVCLPRPAIRTLCPGLVRKHDKTLTGMSRLLSSWSRNSCRLP